MSGKTDKLNIIVLNLEYRKDLYKKVYTTKLICNVRLLFNICFYYDKLLRQVICTYDHQYTNKTVSLWPLLVVFCGLKPT